MKNNLKYVVKTPWDSRALGIETYEILAVSKDAMEEVSSLRGHFTVKIDPQFPRYILHAYGFYHCDSLIEPYCESSQFIYFEHGKASLSCDIPLDGLIAISHGAFYGRFHRDFNIPNHLADLRYDLWLKDLYNEGNVFGLMFENDLAGFLGFSGNKMCLHAIHKKYRGRGLGKYLWGVACRELYQRGHKELVSSISASNLPALNLYASLGFRFRKPLDVYHKLIK
jgi:GNAT superfamily N-acetyltransferase